MSLLKDCFQFDLRAASIMVGLAGTFRAIIASVATIINLSDDVPVIGENAETIGIAKF